jgi:tetratricopeptide (TPR) repeat protein
VACPLGAQIPEKFVNLRVLPSDIARDSLMQVMRGFSFALGVRCQHCHSGGDGVSFAGVAFDADDKPAKRNARFMLQMVDSLNRSILAAMPARSTPPVVVQCVTCHRALAKPMTIETYMLNTIAAAGADSAVRAYKNLRTTRNLDGTFDFTEWRMNEVARHLSVAGKTAEAIAILEMNLESYPRSASIVSVLADLHRQRGEREKAIERYRDTLRLAPNHPEARRRLAEYGVPVP